MKKTTKQIYRNIGISVFVIGICIYALSMLNSMSFIDRTQSWAVYGTVIICMVIFAFYLYLLIKELANPMRKQWK